MRTDGAEVFLVDAWWRITAAITIRIDLGEAG